MEKILNRAKNNEAGFSLIEILLSIVLIGIAIPTFSNYFGGLGNSKQPEYFTEAAFLATRQMEGIRNETLSRIPAAGTYDCVTFQTSPVGADLNIDCTNPDYQFDWLVQDVTAGAPNDSSPGAPFGRKVTLTVSRPTGGMNSFQLVNLF